MNKFKKSLFVVLGATLGIAALTSCGGSDAPSTSGTSSQPTPEPPAPTPDPDPWYVVSEKGMTNFFNKLGESSYTVYGDESGGLTTAVHDENTVTWFFKEDSSYVDHFCVTVDYETYYGVIDDKTDPDNPKLAQMTFMDKDNAVNVSEPVLPTYWASKEICGGNIWSLFHNFDQEHPLRYTVSKNLNFNDSICAMCDFGGFEDSKIDDLLLEFDQVDVTKATLSFTHIPSGTQTRVPGSLSIEFGKDVRTSDLVSAWVNNPDRDYPEPVGDYGAWPSQFATAVRNIYAANLLTDPTKALPYDDFFSYATNFNSKTYMYDDFVQVHDFHATQEGVEQYMDTLVAAGFTPAVGPSGTVFRSPELRHRDGYQLFADVSLTYTPGDGLIIKTQPYYTHTSYGTRELVNTHIQSAQGQGPTKEKFPEFPAPTSAAITKFYGEDEQFHGYEDRVGFYDYDLFMYVHIEYKDSKAMDDYLNAYYNELLNRGFTYNRSYQEYSKSDLESKCVMRIEDISNGKATFLFWNEKYVNPDVAIANVNTDGFPNYEETLSKESINSIMDIKGYFKFIDGLDFKYYYSMQTNYDSYQTVKGLADAYGDALIDAEFSRTSSSLRTVRYVKNVSSSLSLVCEMDYDARSRKGTYLNIWFAYLETE